MTENINNISKQMEVDSNERLTEIQKENLQVIQALPEKYPHAFTRNNDLKGRPYLILRDSSQKSDGELLPSYRQEFTIICEDGVLTITPHKDNEDHDHYGGTFKPGLDTDQFFDGNYDLTPIINDENNNKFITINNKKKKNDSPEISVLSRKNFRNIELEPLKKIFVEAEKKNIKTEIGAEKIISGL